MLVSPKIYHIKNLTPQERNEIMRADFLMRETLAYRRDSILMDLADPTITSFEKMRLEEHLSALDGVWEEYKSTRLDEITMLLEEKPAMYEKYIREHEPEDLGDYWDTDELYEVKQK